MKMQKFALTLLLTLGALKAQAAFEENARRYLSAQEIIQTLQVVFDLMPDCLQVTATNSSMLGVNSPTTGNPIAPSPTQSTVQWVAVCVSNATSRFMLPAQFPLAYEKLKVLIGPEAIAALKTPVPGLPNYDADQVFSYRILSRWTDLPATVRSKMVANMVLVVLGSDEVINDFGLIDPNLMRSKIEGYASDKPDLTVIEMIKFISVNLSVRDEFLSY